MAFEREPQYTEKWKRITSCTDGKEQGKLIREYICELEDEIYNLEQQLECERRNNQYDVVDRIMKLPVFKDWLSEHDSSMNNYYSDYTFNGGF